MAATIYHPIPVDSVKYTWTERGNARTPTSFEAFLHKPLNGLGQLLLRIKLKVKFRQLQSQFLTLDADGNPFFTTPWTGPDWAQFIAQAQSQANLWNNRFWLVPPVAFDDYNVVFMDVSGKPSRPYVRCELYCDFAPEGDGFKTIDVANLSKVMLTAQHRTQSPGTFRSHSMLWDSLDGTPWPTPYGSGPGAPAVHYVIAHEIGHLLGLGHIGEIRKTSLCVVAEVLDAVGAGAAAPPNQQGGTNSLACYGYQQALSLSDNIMGAGSVFSADVGMPWLWAMIAMRKRPYEMGWSVTATDPGTDYIQNP